MVRTPRGYDRSEILRVAQNDNEELALEAGDGTPSKYEPPGHGGLKYRAIRTKCLW